MDRSYFLATAFFFVGAFFLVLPTFFSLVAAVFLRTLFLGDTFFVSVFLVAALFAVLPVLVPASRLAAPFPGRAPLARPAAEARAERYVMVNRICSPTG